MFHVKQIDPRYCERGCETSSDIVKHFFTKFCRGFTKQNKKDWWSTGQLQMASMPHTIDPCYSWHGYYCIEHFTKQNLNKNSSRKNVLQYLIISKI